MRLKLSQDYRRVFDAKCKLVTAFFVVYMASNQLEVARLGVIASKRCIRLATKRNQVRRLCREHFRVCSQQLRGYDWVIIARSVLANQNKLEQHRQLKKLLYLIEVKWLNQ